MLEKFNSYYQTNKLFIKTEKILLTVSGGKDSMLMAHLFLQKKLNFGIAHCNFKLRGDDADQDEQFVKAFAKKNSISFYNTNFETEKHATKKGISTQMAARELRYDWFEKIRQKNNYQYLATAHHKNDVAETMLINLTKGTGLAGLHGIKNKNGNIIRPMLCFNSTEIDNYVKENNISYREDFSNSDTKYTRNLIRHKIIPELEKINPALIETLNIEAHQFLNDEKIILGKALEEKERLFIKEGGLIKIEIEKLKSLNPLKSYLYYFLRDFGFNTTDVADIVVSFDRQPGKVFYSPSYEIVRDREFLILKKLEQSSIEIKQINSVEDFPFNYQILDVTSNFEIEKSNQYAYLDADKVQFPLILRKWKHGDTFQPLGMKGNKKVSDFLIDNKISVIEKETTRVLESKGQIIWLVGYRIDDQFKITPSAKKALILSLID